MKWGENLTFMVADKMFVIFGLDQTPITASFKVDDEDFERMQHAVSMKPAPYLARYKWISVEDISLIPPNEWKRILDNAYELIKAKLPAKILKNL